MPDDIFGGVFRGIIHLILQFIVEFVFEILIKGAGYSIVKPLARKNIDPDGLLVIVVGLTFWVLILIGSLLVWQAL